MRELDRGTLGNISHAGFCEPRSMEGFLALYTRIAKEAVT
jgi:hypothetical protein